MNKRILLRLEKGRKVGWMNELVLLRLMKGRPVG